MRARLLLLLLLPVLLAAPPARASDAPRDERVTTLAPFPRGLAIVDDELYVLCRGRVRGAGGVTAAIDDQAGTIYRVDPNRTGPIAGPPIDAVATNGTIFARPTSPPFRLWDREADPPWADRWTDRPYCTLRYHAATDSFYICGFSGIDKALTETDRVAFSKNLTDTVLRYDRRTGRWSEVERHDIAAGGTYPHHDPRANPPPHGWLNGPNNCLPLGDRLYAVAKDNSRLVEYDLRAIAASPDALPPASRVVMEAEVQVRGLGPQRYAGQSALAYRDGFLYIGYRTSSVILRIPLDDAFAPVEPIQAELVARFDPHDPVTHASANLTDMDFDAQGRLYVISAQPARVFRFRPDPANVFDARQGRRAPWLDLAAETGNASSKSENVLHHDGWLYITSGDGYDDPGAARGTVYRARIDD